MKNKKEISIVYKIRPLLRKIKKLLKSQTSWVELVSKRLHEASLYNTIRSSGYFDEDWYRLAYAGALEIEKDPLADYIRAGIPNGRDPSPYFNIILYRREHNVPMEEALVDFLRSGNELAAGAYRTEHALLKTQKAFQDQTEMLLSTDNRSTPRPFAVFLQSGAGTLWGDWCPEENRSWDLLVNHYDDSYAGRIPCEVEFRQTGALAGTKCTAVHTMLEKFSHILAPYQYVALLDDDIQFNPGDLTRLFEIVQRNGWEMAQASLSQESQCSYQVFYNKGSGSRSVNGVEVMMPVFSQRVLNDVRDLIGQSISGWGFDTALSMVAARHGWRAAIVDDVIAAHTKPINADIGMFYQMLHRENIYPEIEFTHLQKKYRYTQPLFYEMTR